MKKLMFLMLLASCSVCFAQRNRIVELKNINVNSGKEIDIPRNAAYLFPEFMQGKVFFTDGNIDSAKFNYNSLLKEMQFLDKQGAILRVANIQDIIYVQIGERVFIPVSKKSFAEVLFIDENMVLLAQRQTTYEVSSGERIGAYGQPSSTSAITNYSQMYYGNGQQTGLSVFRNVKFKVEDEFMFETKGNLKKISGKKSFIKEFPAFEDKINEYVKSKKVNFKDEKDLIKLTAYCLQLSQIK